MVQFVPYMLVLPDSQSGGSVWAINQHALSQHELTVERR
jgi:hypothetical protein